MRPALGLLGILVALSSCAQSCGAVGGIADDMRFGGMYGDMRPAVDDGAAPAVVGIDWPEGGAYGTIQILYEASKETTFADNDPVETPTHFGALTLAITQATLADRPTYQTPCDVGPAIPCYYDDGTDYWVDTIVRSSLRFLHNGDGVSCYVVAENSSLMASNGTVLATSRGGLSGFAMMNTNSTTDRWRGQVRSGGSSIWLYPTAGTGLEDQTWAFAVVHGLARDPDGETYWRGATPSSSSGNYSSAPTDADPQTALSIGAFDNGLTHFLGHTFAITCYDAIHGATEVEAVFDAIEAETGVLPQ